MGSDIRTTNDTRALNLAQMCGKLKNLKSLKLDLSECNAGTDKYLNELNK
jgi:hypothetical protein